MKTKIVLFIALLCFCSPSLWGQETGFYFKYNFNQFLLNKSKDKVEYLKGFNKNLQYPGIGRENNIEGSLEFLVMSCGDDELELILRKSKIETGLEGVKQDQIKYAIAIFERAVQKAFKETNRNFLKENTEKYLTSFTVLFDNFPFEEDKQIYEKYDFVIKGDKVELKIQKSH